MAYKTPGALEMAVKEAAKASPLDTGRAIANFYFHRLLCRVFADGNSTFVLKGGLGMLARTTAAREATRDADLATSALGAEGALKELRRLAATDLGDFVTFQFEGAEPIRAEDEYREGFKATFTPHLGAKAMQAITVDLVADPVPCADPD